MAEADASNLGAWRQGSVLPHGAAVRLGLLTEADAAEHCVVLISHDCDIANITPGVESNVEIIVARIIRTADGTLTHGKSPRTLHIEWDHAAKPRVLELKASGKRSLLKAHLLGDRPDLDYRLRETATGLFLLRYWLGVRYNRSSFPDEFNARLQRTKAGDEMLRVLKNHPQVTGVYLKLNTLDELPAEAQTPYEIDMFLAFHPGDDPEEAQGKTDQAAEAIETAFATRCYRDDRGLWEWLALKGCTAISEAEFPVAQAKQLQQLTLDYLSLRSNPPGATSFGAINR